MSKNKHVAVCLEHRFYQFEDKTYTKLAFSYFYWQDYLKFFDKVTVVARVKKVNKLDDDMVIVSGENVTVYPLPYYLGVKEFIFKFPSLTKSLFNAASNYDYFLLRSGNSTNILFLILLVTRKPFIREYPGNIKEGVIGFAGDTLKIRILASFLDNMAKTQARYSKANSFVSEYCKDLYQSTKPSFVFSSFKSSEIIERKTDYKIVQPVNIISVGRLEGEKGHIKLLEAVSHLNEIVVHLVGDGHQREILQSYATTNNIDVKFYGTITDRVELFSILKNSDIFVIPSFTEGMPRALLEAMTIGLPCIGSNVGGIPEVLESNDLYESDVTEQLVDMLNQVIDSESRRKEMGRRNKQFIESHFSDRALTEKKQQFWSMLYE